MDPYHRKKSTARATEKVEEGSGGGGGGVWTEERHASFLNRIEESFVRKMLGGGGDFDGNRAMRLDRYLPDSATESTRDSQSATSGNRPPALADPGTQNSAARNHVNKRRMLQQRESDASQDQVVPQSERTKVDKANNAPKSKKGGNQASRWL